jgi:pilus assembly protein Flp/PilA
LSSFGDANELRTIPETPRLSRKGPNNLQEFEMRSICKTLVSFVKNEDGPTAVEYAVMLSLIIVVCIAAITTLGSNANQAFSFVGSNIKG